jgi:hypothetical protein
LIDEGISILKSSAPSEANNCPLCGQYVSDLLDHLQKKLKEEIQTQIAQLKNEKAQLEERKKHLKI